MPRNQDYQERLQRFLNIAPKNRIAWLARNNREIMLEGLPKQYFLTISNPYRKCITCFIKQYSISEYEDLDVFQQQEEREIRLFFKNRGFLHNPKNMRSIKDIYHFHLIK